jgi:hypothetical protein
MNRIRIVGAFSIVIAAIALVALAGPLDPPVGPIVSTSKPLSEVEPRLAINATNAPPSATGLFRISQPGSYYLTGNITGVSGKQGIEINSSGVTLDLNGFELTGVPGSLTGIAPVNTLYGLEVRNGSLRGWGNRGIDLSGFLVYGARLIDLRASGNGSAGIRASNGANLSNCTSANNGAGGFDINISSTIAHCTAVNNTGVGFTIGGSCTLDSCTVASNTADGIDAGSGSTITGCTIYSNGGAGVFCGTGCLVSRCNVYGNMGDGISTNYYNTILENNCSGNTGAANIHANFNENRIEGNQCATGQRGILVQGSSNLVIRNSCTGASSANWSIATNNDYGPVIDRTTGVGGGFTGNSATSTLNTTDPNANFSY